MGITEHDVARLTDHMERMLFKMKSVDRFCMGELTEGLTFAEFQTVIFIGKNGPARMSHIAEKLSMSVSNLTMVVDKLVKKKLAERARSEADRRVVEVRLLENGVGISENHHRMKLEVSRDILALLDREERQKYIELMEKITKNE